MESVKRRWYNMSLRKALVCYVTAAAVLALALCAITSNLCDFLVKEIYEAYPETVEKYYLTNERGSGWGMEVMSGEILYRSPRRISEWSIFFGPSLAS